jgi:hypothetical protein
MTGEELLVFLFDLWISFPSADLIVAMEMHIYLPQFGLF